MNRPLFDQMTDREERRLGEWINHKLGSAYRKQVQEAKMKAELEQEPKQERELKCQE